MPVLPPASCTFQSTCHIRGMTSAVQRRFSSTGISIHMPHTWHDRSGHPQGVRQGGFQSTCHIRGMTPAVVPTLSYIVISIHMPHTWHDHGVFLRFLLMYPFQSTCHIRGMTCRTRGHSWRQGFQSTCHIRGMTFYARSDGQYWRWISIHMPHTWHDFTVR